MGLLYGKRILLGVSGSIAAYKSAYLVRELIKAGGDVQVIFTPSAREFVTPLTFATLSKRPVLDALVSDSEKGIWNNHVELGLWADLFIIAPASANTLAGMAQGTAQNLLLTTYLSATCPVFFAPAMDLDMHAHASNQANIDTLIERGNVHIPSEAGELASGLSGTGRMAEPENITRFIENYLRQQSPLCNQKVLITAGPTQEPIDPVRYIGNRSSGKMGYALAATAARLGADVTVVSGPVAIPAPPNVEIISVETAVEMYSQTVERFPLAKIAILAAAVADYRPIQVASEKIKKADSTLTIDLEKTDDILKKLGTVKTNRQTLVGFALETENPIENAQKKLYAKNCDLIVLNSLKDSGAGFGHDTNKVTLVSHNNTLSLELKSKQEVAEDIFAYLIDQFL